MALEILNVNEVYKSVLAILNKEQRGYITPYEFNLLATQVQLEIFESYFDSLSMQLQKPGNDNEYADKIKMLRQKISRFEHEQDITVTTTSGSYCSGRCKWKSCKIIYCRVFEKAGRCSLGFYYWSSRSICV
jgi:hypothetical protein